MDKIVTVLLCVCIPMAVMQILYRIVDRDGLKTAVLAEKLPIIKRRKFLVQILLPMLFIVFFGMISILCGIPIYAFCIVCGVLIGIINGMAVTLMCCLES